MKNKIRKLHFLRLVVRGALLIAACAAYFFGHRIGSKMLSLRSPVFAVIWLSFVVDMILRFFPSRYESMGCQKQFERNYRPTEGKPQLSEAAKKRNLRSVIIVAIVWIALNGVIGALHIAGVLDDAAMLIVMLFFSVCDIICILFYCPFQSLLMKNRCCVNCRIYNWDFAMMFTPAIFVDSLFTWSLFILAIARLIRWEVLYARHPERFS